VASVERKLIELPVTDRDLGWLLFYENVCRQRTISLDRHGYCSVTVPSWRSMRLFCRSIAALASPDRVIRRG
jgi:hypothetical protein